MRTITLAFGVSQLLLALLWSWVWLAERRQRPAPHHLRQQPPASPRPQRQHATLAATLAIVSLVVAIFTLIQAWRTS
jgi:hypothetical protein